MFHRNKSISRVYVQVTRADGTVEPIKLVAINVLHPNPIKRLYYLIKEKVMK